MKKTDAHKFLPLKPLHHLILLLLEEAPTYGVELLERLAAVSEGAMRPNVGSLYRTIARLTDDGLIEPSEPEDGASDSHGPPRKVYAVTALGRSVLRAETARQATLLERAGKLGLRKS